MEPTKDANTQQQATTPRTFTTVGATSIYETKPDFGTAQPFTKAINTTTTQSINTKTASLPMNITATQLINTTLPMNTTTNQPINTTLPMHTTTTQPINTLKPKSIALSALPLTSTLPTSVGAGLQEPTAISDSTTIGALLKSSASLTPLVPATAAAMSASRKLAPSLGSIRPLTVAAKRAPYKYGTRWSKEEDAIISSAVERIGDNWSSIARLLPGRSPPQCMQRWRKFLMPGLKKGIWDYYEDDLLRNYTIQEVRIAQRLGKRVNWTNVAMHIPNRTAKQCRERWVNHLNPGVRKVPWSLEEDKLLLELEAQFPSKWARIARNIEGRTENMVKVRFKTLIRNCIKGGNFPQALIPVMAEANRQKAKIRDARAMIVPLGNLPEVATQQLNPNIPGLRVKTDLKQEDRKEALARAKRKHTAELEKGIKKIVSYRRNPADRDNNKKPRNKENNLSKTISCNPNNIEDYEASDTSSSSSEDEGVLDKKRKAAVLSSETTTTTGIGTIAASPAQSSTVTTLSPAVDVADTLVEMSSTVAASAGDNTNTNKTKSAAKLHSPRQHAHLVRKHTASLGLGDSGTLSNHVVSKTIKKAKQSLKQHFGDLFNHPGPNVNLEHLVNLPRSNSSNSQSNNNGSERPLSLADQVSKVMQQHHQASAAKVQQANAQQVNVQLQQQASAQLQQQANAQLQQQASTQLQQQANAQLQQQASAQLQQQANTASPAPKPNSSTGTNVKDNSETLRDLAAAVLEHQQANLALGGVGIPEEQLRQLVAAANSSNNRQNENRVPSPPFSRPNTPMTQASQQPMRATTPVPSPAPVQSQQQLFSNLVARQHAPPPSVNPVTHGMHPLVVYLLDLAQIVHDATSVNGAPLSLDKELGGLNMSMPRSTSTSSLDSAIERQLSGMSNSSIANAPTQLNSSMANPQTRLNPPMANTQTQLNAQLQKLMQQHQQAVFGTTDHTGTTDWTALLQSNVNSMLARQQSQS